MSFDKPFRLTCYCSACNEPKGSTATASGAVASAEYTVAVHRELYNQFRGRIIEIGDLGEFKIQDKHGKGKQVIDIYIGDFEKCRCTRDEYNKYNVSGVYANLLED